MGIRCGTIAAEHLNNAGRHLSYLGDLNRINQKIAASLTREFNTAAFLDVIDIDDNVRHRRDFFSRPGIIWDVVEIEDLPAHVLSGPDRYRHLNAK